MPPGKSCKSAQFAPVLKRPHGTRGNPGNPGGIGRVGNYRLPGTTVYVTLEPCVMCLGAMLHAGSAKLVFGARDCRSGAAGSVLDLTAISSFNHRIEVTEGVRAGECSEILKEFFRVRRG